MRTVHEVSELTGVSIRTLQYYDRIGLLHPAEYTEAGYRLYDDAALETLQQILLFRELEFPLKDIRRILQSPSFDRQKALDQQIGLLELTEIAGQIRKGADGTEPADDGDLRGVRRNPEYGSGIRESAGPGPETAGFHLRSLLYLHKADPVRARTDVRGRRGNDREYRPRRRGRNRSLCQPRDPGILCRIRLPEKNAAITAAFFSADPQESGEVYNHLGLTALIQTNLWVASVQALNPRRTRTARIITVFLTFRVSSPVAVNVLWPQTEQCMVKCLKVSVLKFSFPQFAQRIFLLFLPEGVLCLFKP